MKLRIFSRICSNLNKSEEVIRISSKAPFLLIILSCYLHNSNISVKCETKCLHLEKIDFKIFTKTTFVIIFKLWTEKKNTLCILSFKKRKIGYFWEREWGNFLLSARSKYLISQYIDHSRKWFFLVFPVNFIINITILIS